MKKETLGLLFLLSSTAFASELTLQEALDQAEKTNNSIIEKTLEKENASLDLENSKIDKLPTFDWSSSLDKDDDSDSYSHSVSIKQSLYKGNAITNGIEKSELELEKTELERLSEIEGVKLEVTTYYMNALKYQTQLDIYNTSLEELKTQYEEQKLLYENKLIAKSEILELESEMIETESSIIETNNNYKVELEKLKNVIQLNSSEELTLSMPNLSTESINYTSDLAEIKDTNLDVKIAVLDEKISAENIEIQKADYLPDVDFSFTYSSADEELGQSFGEWEWKAGLNFTYELFDWGETKNTVKQSENSYEIQKIAQKEIADQAELELKTKYFELEKYEKQIEAQKKLVEAREEKYKIDKVKFESKYIDLATYIESKNDVTTSQLELINLETEYYIAYKEYIDIIK